MKPDQSAVVADALYLLLIAGVLSALPVLTWVLGVY